MNAARKYSCSQAEEFDAGEAFSGRYLGRLNLLRADLAYQGAICLCRSLLVPAESIARSILSVEEGQVFAGLRFEKRMRSFVMGRYAAKTAISLLTDEQPADIHIGYGVFKNPLVESVGAEGRIETSITHTSEIGAALAFPAPHPMGIDVERIDPSKAVFIERELTAKEIALLKGVAAEAEYASLLAAAWTMKESLSKVFRTGLMTPLSVYEISSLEKEGASYLAHFSNFGQYKAISFSLGDHFCSIACPKKTECEFDLTQLLSQLC